jgi:ribose transport system ATP-binding protein
VGLSLSAKSLVEHLSPGERQLVEIAKGLNQQARLMILDEPTTSLTDRETRALFALLATLKQEGLALVYVSHTLDDVLSISDQIVVLRDGEVVGEGPKADFTTRRLVSLMVGRELEQQYPAVPPEACQEQGEVVLSVAGLTRASVVQQASFDLHRGEILGIAGLMGSGRTELARLLFGLDRSDQGTITLQGERIDGYSTRKRMERGLAFVTESRREDGLCMAAPIDDNLCLVSAPRYTRWFGALRRRTLASAMTAIRQGVQLPATVLGTRPVRTLSGGNQQKVVLGKWLLSQPIVLIMDEPTRGIDVGAKLEIYRKMVELALQGVALLLISSELEELLGMCHRILVMSQGHFCDELQRSEFHRERILDAALQAHTARGTP